MVSQEQQPGHQGESTPKPKPNDDRAAALRKKVKEANHQSVAGAQFRGGR